MPRARSDARLRAATRRPTRRIAAAPARGPGGAAIRVHARIEAGLRAWGHFVHRRAPWVIALVLLETVGAASQLEHFYIDASLEGFFHEDDPVRVLYDEFRTQFGRDTFIIVALEPAGGVFEAEFLATLRELHERIEQEVPLVVEVTSLVNARETRGVGDELVVGELMEEWPEDEAAVAALERRVLANPLYRNNLVSEDGRLTAILIETEVYSQLGVEEDALAGFDDDGAGDDADLPPAGADETAPRFLTGAEDHRIVAALLALLDEYQSDSLDIDYAGTPILTDQFTAKMQRDMARFTLLALAIIVTSLALLFRRVAAVLLPLVTVIASVVVTLSIMSATGTPLTAPTQIIPSFLLAVGVGGSVHILAIYHQARRRGDSKEDGIAHALGHSGLAVIMTSLTTAGGLLSFMAAELLPISHFGIFAPIGVMVALFYTLTLLPALMAVWPDRAARSEPHGEPLFFSQRLLVGLGLWSAHHSTLVIATWALLVAAALTGATQIRLSHSPFDWFPEGDPVREGMETMGTNMGGMGNFEILVDAGEPNGFHEPELLHHVDALHDFIYDLRENDLRAGKVLSLIDVVKETNQALNENRSDFHVIPDDRRLVAQELLLFENAGSDDVEDLVDSGFQLGRISVRMPMEDSILFPGFIDAAVAEARRLLGPGVQIEVTGIIHVISSTMSAVVHTMVRSYASALAIITPLMVLLIGNLRIGLLAMIPNLAPVILTLGIMGWTGIPLDAFTLLVGSIAIGLAVDDTIHFMHNFRRYHDRTGDVDAAVRTTLETTGQALLFTSLVLAFGFAIYTQAYLTNLFHFGLLTSITIGFAFVADIMLAPALLVKVHARRQADQAGPAD